MGRISDKMQKEKVLYVCVIIFTIGLLAMYLSSNPNLDKTTLMLLFGIAATVMIVGYILISFISGALVRDFTPSENVGKMQGIRMIFSVLLPMLIGPMIGNAINANRAIPLTNSPSADIADTMTTQFIPAPEIFFASAIIALVCFIFIYLLNKKTKNEINA